MSESLTNKIVEGNCIADVLNQMPFRGALKHLYKSKKAQLSGGLSLNKIVRKT